MTEVGSYEAKTHLAELLERVSKGERITITRHGHPIAMLVPVGSRGKLSTKEAIQAIKEFRKGRRLDGLTIREMIEEGRRF
jgi:prevent-host-death family protein